MYLIIAIIILFKISGLFAEETRERPNDSPAGDSLEEREDPTSTHLSNSSSSSDDASSSISPASLGVAQDHPSLSVPEPFLPEDGWPPSVLQSLDRDEQFDPYSDAIPSFSPGLERRNGEIVLQGAENESSGDNNQDNNEDLIEDEDVIPPNDN